jgi:hypothetical protein
VTVVENVDLDSLANKRQRHKDRIVAVAADRVMDRRIF